jgi:predicted small metal-binding protein
MPKKIYTATCPKCNEVVKAYTKENLEKGIIWHMVKKHGSIIKRIRDQ